MAMTVKSGRWSDPTVWDTGVVPGAGAMAHIKAPHQIIYDRESDVILEDVMSEMGSKLTWDSARETRLRANTVMLSGITEIVDKALSATPGKPRHEIIFHPLAGKDPGASTRLGGMIMGPNRIHGFAKQEGLHAALLGGQAVPTIPTGAITIRLPGLSTSGWRVGDVLVVLGTEYQTTVASDPQYSGPSQYYYAKEGSTLAVRAMTTFQFGQDEQRTITAINGDEVSFAEPLAFDHKGMTGTLKDGQAITKAPVVANVSRSIRFRTATAEEDGQLDPYADITVLQKRAHLMIMRQPDTDLRYFETKNMGRTSTDPSLWVDGLPYKVGVGGSHQVDALRDAAGGVLLANPQNVRGRYAIHLHWCGGPHNAAPLVPLIGATAWAPVGAHPIPGWAIVQHGTKAAIERCVVSNVRGAGMVSEIGNEPGHWAYNIVTGVRGDGDTIGWGGRGEHFTNHNGAAGVAYENQSRAILMHGNIAGSSAYAYLWWAQKDNRRKRSPRDVDVRLLDGYAKGSASSNGDFEMDEALGHFVPQIPPFLENEAWACRHGLTVVHRAAGTVLINISDLTPMLIERFHCVNVPRPFDVPQYSNTYYVKDCLFQGPLNMMASSRAFNLGDVSWNWNVSNCHLRNYRYGFYDDGAGLNYNGQLIDITTENVTDFSNVNYREFAKSDLAARPGLEGVMGPWTDNPTQPTNTARRSARIRTYESVDRSALPLPYPLAPYGRKLPAGHPPVNYGDAPYFVLGDGTNGEASTVPVAISLTLTAGGGRNQGRVYGIVRDSVGDMRWPDHQSSESFPINTSIKSHRTLGKLTPEQLIQRWGCWNDNGTWKCRVWFPISDRASHVRAWFHIDHPLTGFHSDFLAQHDLGGPPVAPEWPDKLEAVPDEPRPLTPTTRNLRFLSRTYLEAVDGQALSHRLRPNEVLTQLAIAGGTDAALFKIENQRLVWAGTQPAVRPAPYEVTIRATDSWGNTVETAHQVVVISSARVSPLISDDFNRADENLEARASYLRLTGGEGSLAVRSNRLAIIAGTGAVYDLGSLGTSEQEISVEFVGFNDKSLLLFRMVDESNWLGFRRNDLSGGNLQVFMCVAGVETLLGQFSNAPKMIIRAQGNRLVVTWVGTSTQEPEIRYPKNTGAALLKVLDLAPLAEPGSVVLPDTAPRGTKIGFKVGTSGTNPWLDNFSAKALES